MSIPPLLSKVLLSIAKPFIAKKLSDMQVASGTIIDPNPGQISSQIGKVGGGASLAGIIAGLQYDSVETTVASIAVLLINLVFIYYPEKSKG